MYNILLPVWLIVFIPSWLWLILIPLNYLIDRIVLKWSLGKKEDKGLFCRKHTWKVCIAGFVSVLAGVAILLAVSVILAQQADTEVYDKLFYGIYFNPFSSFFAFLIVAAAVAVSGVCIYFLDRAILKRAGLSAEAAGRSALRMAVITAPYLFFFPTYILYDSGILGL